MRGWQTVTWRAQTATLSGSISDPRNHVWQGSWIVQPCWSRRHPGHRQPEDSCAHVYGGQAAGRNGTRRGVEGWVQLVAVMTRPCPTSTSGKDWGAAKGRPSPAPSEERRAQSPAARWSVATARVSPSGPWDTVRPGRGSHGWVRRPPAMLAADSARSRCQRRAPRPRTQPENERCVPDFMGTPSPADPCDAASLQATITAGDAGGAARPPLTPPLHTACTSGDLEAD